MRGRPGGPGPRRVRKSHHTVTQHRQHMKTPRPSSRTVQGVELRRAAAGSGRALVLDPDSTDVKVHPAVSHLNAYCVCQTRLGKLKKETAGAAAAPGEPGCWTCGPAMEPRRPQGQERTCFRAEASAGPTGAGRAGGGWCGREGWAGAGSHGGSPLGAVLCIFLLGTGCPTPLAPRPPPAGLPHPHRPNLSAVRRGPGGTWGLDARDEGAWKGPQDMLALLVGGSRGSLTRPPVFFPAP